MKWRAVGAGPVVLLVHGIPTSGRLWDDVVEQLQTRFTCITVDLPGFGESPPLADGSRDPQRYARELEALRLTLDIPVWHVIGHDAGAAIAVHYVASWPDRVTDLVLCSPPVFPEFRVPWFFRVMRTPLLGDVVAPLMSFVIWRVGIHSASARRDATVRAIFEAFHQPFRGFRGVRRFLRVLRWGSPRDVLGRTAALLGDVRARTLVVHGRRDGAIPATFAERVSSRVVGAELEYLECGHFVPLDAAGPFCRRVERFFEAGSTAGAPGILRAVRAPHADPACRSLP